MTRSPHAVAVARTPSSARTASVATPYRSTDETPHIGDTAMSHVLPMAARLARHIADLSSVAALMTLLVLLGHWFAQGRIIRVSL